VAAYTFPAEAFVIEGEPETVREVSRGYGRFAAVAAEAAAGLRGMDSGAWVGSEGDLFRARVAEIPPHLDIAQSAFGQVAGALGGFAEVLASAQHRMAGVRADAEQTYGSLAAARADRSGLYEPSGEEAADQAARMDGRIDRLQASWEEQLVAAGGVRAQVMEAARQAGVAIRAAARTSPTAGQSWLEDRWEKTRSWASEQVDGLKGWVAEHAAGLRSVAKALRVVGVALVAVGAVLAVLGVGGGVMAAGFLLWGAGDVLDATVDWAEGRITGRELLVSAGLAGVKVRIHKSAPRQGMFGQTTPDGVLHLYPNAFRSEEELVKTLGHERTHVWQVKTHGYPTEAERQVYEDAAKATEAQWWDYYQMSRTP
jgi:hypothetical protein